MKVPVCIISFSLPVVCFFFWPDCLLAAETTRNIRGASERTTDRLEENRASRRDKAFGSSPRRLQNQLLIQQRTTPNDRNQQLTTANGRHWGNANNNQHNSGGFHKLNNINNNNMNWANRPHNINNMNWANRPHHTDNMNWANRPVHSNNVNWSNRPNNSNNVNWASRPVNSNNANWPNRPVNSNNMNWPNRPNNSNNNVNWATPSNANNQQNTNWAKRPSTTSPVFHRLTREPDYTRRPTHAPVYTRPPTQGPVQVPPTSQSSQVSIEVDEAATCLPAIDILCLNAGNQTTVFCNLIRQFDIEETLVPQGGSGITIFAPTDAAFAKLEGISLNPEQFVYVFLYHLVASENGPLAFEDLQCTQLITALNGKSSRTKCNDKETIKYQKGSGNSGESDTLPKIIEANVLACGRVIIHLIDSVILPILPEGPLDGAMGDEELNEVEQEPSSPTKPEGDEESTIEIENVTDSPSILPMEGPSAAVSPSVEPTRRPSESFMDEAEVETEPPSPLPTYIGTYYVSSGYYYYTGTFDPRWEYNPTATPYPTTNSDEK